jgi:hypothetical protein
MLGSRSLVLIIKYVYGKYHLICSLLTEAVAFLLVYHKEQLLPIEPQDLL